MVVPDHPDFLAWVDSIKAFRNRQGILTQLVTTTEMGVNNFAQLKNYIVNAFNNRDLALAAILYLADYGTSGNTITSGTQSNYITDNLFIDMNGNHMRGITKARITARNANELEIMSGRILFSWRLMLLNSALAPFQFPIRQATTTACLIRAKLLTCSS